MRLSTASARLPSSKTQEANCNERHDGRFRHGIGEVVEGEGTAEGITRENHVCDSSSGEVDDDGGRGRNAWTHADENQGKDLSCSAKHYGCLRLVLGATTATPTRTTKATSSNDEHTGADVSSTVRNSPRWPIHHPHPFALRDWHESSVGRKQCRGISSAKESFPVGTHVVSGSYRGISFGVNFRVSSRTRTLQRRSTIPWTSS